MPIPKNAFTTNSAARAVRRLYRRGVRSVAQDGLATFRSSALRGKKANDPDYLIVGVNKAGTTSIQQMLSGRGDVGRPLRKELHYFDRFPTRTREWYRAQFWGDANLLWGEATPEYFELPESASYVAREFPSVKIIVCLRDPLARAVSHYHNAVDHAAEDRDIVTAFAAEMERLRRGEVARSPRELRNAYIQRSLYGRSLPLWRDLFGERLLVVNIELGDATRRAVLNHLSLSAQGTSVLPRSNSRRYEEPPASISELMDPLINCDKHQVLESAQWTDWPTSWRPS